MTEEIILPCPHCGNTTVMTQLHKYKKRTTVYFDGPQYEGDFDDFFEFLECPVCKEYHIFHSHWNSEDSYLEDYNIYEEGQVIFPVQETLNLGRLPLLVKKAYESALKVKNIDSTSCMIALRRTLEMVCKDKEAKGRQLHNKLTDLQEKGVLPYLMGDLSLFIKDYGNKAAHGDDITFNKYMVESMFRFINKILEYVYVLPTEMKKIKREMELLTEKLT